MSHLQLPVGAAAILVISFVSVREYRSPELGSIYLPQVTVQEIAAERASDLMGEASRSPVQMPVATVNSTILSICYCLR